LSAADIVGTVVAVGFAHLGYVVRAVEVDERKLQALQRGVVPFWVSTIGSSPTSKRLRAATKAR
jgi:UDP-glucose 6-dehydrogenase